MEKPISSCPKRSRWHRTSVFPKPGCTESCGHRNGTQSLLLSSPTCLLASPLAKWLEGITFAGTGDWWMRKNCISQSDRPELEFLFHQQLIVWPWVDYLNWDTLSSSVRWSECLKHHGMFKKMSKVPALTDHLCLHHQPSLFPRLSLHGSEFKAIFQKVLVTELKSLGSQPPLRKNPICMVGLS